jgi:hypothetical protein
MIYMAYTLALLLGRRLGGGSLVGGVSKYRLLEGRDPSSCNVLLFQIEHLLPSS